jgi:hypothetical protein
MLRELRVLLVDVSTQQLSHLAGLAPSARAIGDRVHLGKPLRLLERVIEVEASVAADGEPAHHPQGVAVPEDHPQLAAGGIREKQRYCLAFRELE